MTTKETKYAIVIVFTDGTTNSSTVGNYETALNEAIKQVKREVELRGRKLINISITAQVES